MQTAAVPAPFVYSCAASSPRALHAMLCIAAASEADAPHMPCLQACLRAALTRSPDCSCLHWAAQILGPTCRKGCTRQSIAQITCSASSTTCSGRASLLCERPRPSPGAGPRPLAALAAQRRVGWPCTCCRPCSCSPPSAG